MNRGETFAPPESILPNLGYEIDLLHSCKELRSQGKATWIPAKQRWFSRLAVQTPE